jgi:hypothetical protein
MFHSSVTGRHRNGTLPDESRSCQALHQSPRQYAWEPLAESAQAVGDFGRHRTVPFAPSPAIRRVDLRHRSALGHSHQGPGRTVGVAMAFKVIESAQQRWRMVNAPHLVALVRTGATFVNSKLVERPDDQDQQRQERQVA